MKAQLYKVNGLKKCNPAGRIFTGKNSVTGVVLRCWPETGTALVVLNKPQELPPRATRLLEKCDFQQVLFEEAAFNPAIRASLQKYFGKA